MIELPKRNDSIYKEIEQFKDYEFTNCIAFEMAIRNKEVKYLLDEYNELFKSKFDENKRTLLLKKLSFYGFPHIPAYGLNLKDIKFKDGNKIKRNNDNHSIGYPIYYFTNLNDLSKVKVDCFKDIVTENRTTKYHTVTSRYLLKFENIKKVDIEINLSLPKDELIAYILKIKDEYDKDNSIVKTPLELLGEDFEKSDNKHTQKKSNAEKYADWFYIYDYWTFEKMKGKTDKEIFVNLEVENDIPYKEESIRKIQDKMIYLIDDLGYKELITGVKNS